MEVFKNYVNRENTKAGKGTGEWRNDCLLLGFNGLRETGRYDYDSSDIIWKSLDGDNYGKRKFAIVLRDPDLVDELIQNGAIVKNKETQNGIIQYIEVKLKYGVNQKGQNYGPKIELKDNYGSKIMVTEEDLYEVDRIKFTNVDMIISPYLVEGNIYYKLQSMRAEFIKDDFEDRVYGGSNPVDDDDDLPF